MYSQFSEDGHRATLLGPLYVFSRVKKMYGSSDFMPLIDGSWRKDSGNIIIFNLKWGDGRHLSKYLKSNSLFWDK